MWTNNYPVTVVITIQLFGYEIRVKTVEASLMTVDQSLIVLLLLD